MCKTNPDTRLNAPSQPPSTRASTGALTRRTFHLSLLLAASIAVPNAYAQPKPERSKIAIAVGGKASFYHLPLTIAEQLGYFKAEGLDVEIVDFASSARAMQAVASGSADVVSGAYEQILNLQSKNQFFQSFVLQGRAPQVALGVSTKTMPDFQTWADLKGHRMGIAAPGGSTNMVANLVLSGAGLKTSEVSYVGVGNAAGALAALRSGQIDAISNMDPVMTILEQKGDVKIISDTRTLKGTLEVFGGPMPAACLYASQEFVQKNPHTTHALTNAIVRSLKWLHMAGPSDIMRTVPEAYLLGDQGLYLAAFGKMREAISPDGLFPDEGSKTALRALGLFDASVSAEKFELGKTYTNEFALRAKDKFKA
jgi:NitT/TauT family transport system substrate-binding protein